MNLKTEYSPRRHNLPFDSFSTRMIQASPHSHNKEELHIKQLVIKFTYRKSWHIPTKPDQK